MTKSLALANSTKKAINKVEDNSKLNPNKLRRLHPCLDETYQKNSSMLTPFEFNFLLDRDVLQ